MKRVVNGKTYDTSTATCIARCAYQTEKDEPVYENLHRSRGGAFFLVRQIGETSRRYFDHEVDEPSFEFFPLTRDEAEGWMNEGDIEVFGDHPFGWPPEAAGEDNKKQAVN